MSQKGPQAVLFRSIARLGGACCKLGTQDAACPFARWLLGRVEDARDCITRGSSITTTPRGRY
eukprot:67273-Pyramimonas_sp.AAC.1